MSGDIEKLAVFDGRIIQSRPKYAVEKGALSLTNAPFNAIAATPSQHTYNIYVPSENVFVDRALEWTSTVNMAVQVTFNQAVPAGQPLLVWGRDVALAAFPLNQLCSTLTATINDTTSVINSQDVLNTVLRMCDHKKNRLQRTCPTMLDKYQNYNDAFGAINNPLAGWENATAEDEVPNGAFYNVVFTGRSGQALVGSTATPVANSGVGGAADWVYTNGTPVAPPAGYAAGATVNIWYQWTSTEKLVLSPFTFSDCHEWDTGLFGINNIQLIMNLQSPARTLRSSTGAGRAVVSGSIGYNQNATSAFQQSVVNVIFLTPSLDVPLPPKSVVPYMEFPRYITQYQNGTIAAGDKGQIISQTITLPQIPDLFIIYARPQQYVDGANQPDPTQGDWYFPLATRADSVNNPISINFDNFSGLLSSVTAEELYAMSVKNGLNQSWNEWVGYAHSVKPTFTGPAYTASSGAGRVPLVGGPLVLKPSQDITLQTGQSPSLVGNFTFQFSLWVRNTASTPQTPQLYVITANSGFFESIRGSSRIIKGVLSEQDIISAPLAPSAPTRDMLQRMVGGGMAGSLANVLSKAKDVYAKTAPRGGGDSAGSMSAGGVTGGGDSAGSMCGAGARKGRKGLHARLM